MVYRASTWAVTVCAAGSKSNVGPASAGPAAVTRAAANPKRLGSGAVIPVSAASFRPVIRPPNASAYSPARWVASRAAASPVYRAARLAAAASPGRPR